MNENRDLEFDHAGNLSGCSHGIQILPEGLAILADTSFKTTAFEAKGHLSTWHGNPLRDSPFIF
jgi:hypothetical protein